MMELEKTLKGFGNIKDVFAFIEKNYNRWEALGRVVSDYLKYNFHFFSGDIWIFLNFEV